MPPSVHNKDIQGTVWPVGIVVSYQDPILFRASSSSHVSQSTRHNTNKQNDVSRFFLELL